MPSVVGPSLKITEPVGVTVPAAPDGRVTVAVSAIVAPLVTVGAAAVSTVLVSSPTVILRILLLERSATYTVPSPPTATAKGALKLAAVPVPSALPAVPEPASVATIPAAVTVRILWLPRSATWSASSAPIASP